MSPTRDRFKGERQSIYFPTEMLAEIRAEARRQRRSISQMVQIAWLTSRDRIRRFPDSKGQTE